MRHRVLVIGGGPAGLTAAYELGKLGAEATVLEADESLGGLSRTVVYGGYRFDIGGHRFFSRVPLINQLWREILGDDLMVRQRLSRIYYGGRFFDYPLKPFNALAGLGPLEVLRVCASYVRARLAPEDEVSFEQWVSNRFGRRLFEIFFKTYTEKVWGMPCSQISADWAAQRIKDLSLGEAVRHALFGSGSNGQVATSLIEQFYYPRLGPGMMWERCAELVRDLGGAVLCGHRVEQLCHNGERITAVRVRDTQGQSVELEPSHVISSMALRDLVDTFDPALPAEIRDAAHRLRYRDYLTVVLVIRKENVFPDNWIYIHSPEVSLGRIQNYKNWSPHMVPDVSRTVLGLEYFLWDGDPEWSWNNAQLIERGTRDCVRIGLIRAEDVEDATVVRVPKAYPVYDHGYRDAVATVRSGLMRFANLQVVGRNGQHRYNNQDHSMLAGLYAARNIAGRRYDVWEINTANRYLEDGDVAAEERLVPSALAIAPVVQQALFRVEPGVTGAVTAVLCGLGIFLATAILLVKGGSTVGPNLALLGQYLPGYTVSWPGAVLGMLEAAAGGFCVGYAAKWLQNRLVARYLAHGRSRRFLDDD